MTSPVANLAVSAAPWWVACAFAGAIALAAWRAGSLRADGAVAAFVIGTLALRVQWAWGAYLIGWFALATALSRVGHARKAARTRDIVSKGNRRDAAQVLANGGVFVLAAVIVLLGESTGDRWPRDTMAALAAIGAAGALAASGADTWSTEIGTLVGGEPWSLRSFRRVPPGTSGAVTWNGSLGAVLGALLLSGLAYGVSMIAAPAVWPVAWGGVAGATVDTLLGALMQERRACPTCGRLTERLEHCDGTATTHVGGIRHLNNDVVNVACSLTGAAVAVVLATRGIK
ncbi:MAG: DUF92 domain-containing protein [Gemmatimonadaceae bacterium]|nr:DUF92 domain-containing protein [Gemmatimonadaceae bacterium]